MGFLSRIVSALTSGVGSGSGHFGGTFVGDSSASGRSSSSSGNSSSGNSFTKTNTKSVSNSGGSSSSGRKSSSSSGSGHFGGTFVGGGSATKTNTNNAHGGHSGSIDSGGSSTHTSSSGNTHGGHSGSFAASLPKGPEAATKEEAAIKDAVEDYMSGISGPRTWEQAKEENPLLTDEALLRYYGPAFHNNNPGVIAGPSDASIIAHLESQATAARALRIKSSPDYIARDYNEYVDLVNQGLIAPKVRTDTTGKQVTIPYSTSREDYNAYLQNKYGATGDDYYNRSYSEMADYNPEFWARDPEAFDADGNPTDVGTYLWLLNNPLTRALMQGISASSEFSGTGPSLQQIMQDPSVGGYGLYSEADVANMYAGHILAGDDLGVMLENDPVLLGAILTQAYTPRVDPNNPVTYDVPMVTNPDGTKSRDPDKGVSGTLNLAEGYKTPAQLAAELVENPSSAAGMTNLQLVAAANMLNNQTATTPEDSEESDNKRSGSGGSGSGGYGGGSMPAGGNPETTNTLYSMPEVGNYAAQMILNRMLPTGYDYDYNKRLDKRLADMAAAEQNYKGSVLPSVERTYQDQAANTMANLVAALRANRASGLTSGASRGAQAASDVQAVQAASKENSESLNKLVNENLASFLTQLAGKRATAGNDTASELQGYASPMMTALAEVLAQYNYGSAAAQVNNGGLRRMQSYLV